MRLLLAGALLAAAAPLRAQAVPKPFAPDEPAALAFPALSTPTLRTPSFVPSLAHDKAPAWAGMKLPSVPPASLDALFDGSGKPEPRGTAVIPNLGLKEKLKGPWTYRFSFGPSRTTYFKTDVYIKSSKITGYLRGVELRERTSLEYYKFWQQPTPLNFIDEPTNTMVFSAENTRKKYALNLVVFHPKFLIAADGLNTHVHLAGEVDGQRVDSQVDLNEIFGQYQLTKGQLDVQGQYQKILPIFEHRKAGTLEFRPGVGLGVIIGAPYASYLNKKHEEKGYEGTIAPTGGSLSLSSQLMYIFPNDRLSLSVAEDFTVGRMRYNILDGHAVHDLAYNNINFSAGWRLYKGKKK